MAGVFSMTADLTGGLVGLQRELDAALADMMQVCNAASDGTYKTVHPVGIMEVGVTLTEVQKGEAKQRACRTCFLTCVGKFISFLDRLIASQRVTREGISITRDLDIQNEEEVKVYCLQYMETMVAA